MTFWTVTVLGVYLILIIAISFYSSRGAGKNAESFFVANRPLNWLQESTLLRLRLPPWPTELYHKRRGRTGISRGWLRPSLA